MIKKKIIRIDNADTFSQPPLNIFTKGANNYDHDLTRLGEQKRILNKNITNLTVQKLLTDSIYLYLLFFFQK